jgi:hypothetical protein
MNDQPALHASETYSTVRGGYTAPLYFRGGLVPLPANSLAAAVGLCMPAASLKRPAAQLTEETR